MNNKEMKKILYISTSPSTKGGISTVIKDYLRSFSPHEYKIYLVTSHIEGSKLLKLLQAIIGMVETFLYMTLQQIDIVHIHGGDIVSSKRKFIYLKLINLFGCKVIYHFHGGSFMDGYMVCSIKWKKRVQYLFEKSNMVICLSESWRDCIVSLMPKANIKVIPNSIRLPKLETVSRDGYGPIYLTFIGLIGEKKGIYDLLSAIKLLINKGYFIRLNIAGTGGVDRLRYEINRLKIGHFVEYLGWIDENERDAILKKTDVFVLPSYAEGMPMSILEAMSYGIPVVSTTVGGIPELVVDGETGILIRPGDINSLSESIEYLILNEDIRKKFGHKGRLIIEKKHNISINIEKIQLLYDTI